VAVFIAFRESVNQYVSRLFRFSDAVQSVPTRLVYIRVQWRRLHRAWGDGVTCSTPTFTNGWARGQHE